MFDIILLEEHSHSSDKEFCLNDYCPNYITCLDSFQYMWHGIQLFCLWPFYIYISSATELHEIDI